MKRRRATKIQRLKRTQRVIDLMVKHGASRTQIIQVLTQNPEDPITERTARRTVERARKMLSAMGSQPTAEERGLLVASGLDLYAAEQNSGNPDRKLQNQILKTRLEIHKTHPQWKGVSLNEPTASNTSGDTLSPILQKLLDEYQSAEDVPEPETGS